MKKKFIIATVILTMIATLSGCLSKEEKEEAKKYEKQAEKNAVEYVKEKYDIDAEVINSQFIKAGMLGETISTYVDVEMEYEDKKFEVHIAGDKEWADIKENYVNNTYDNYQYDVIYADLKEYIEKETKVDIEELSIWYNKVEYARFDHMTNLYYDGDLEAFLEEQYVSVVLVTLDKELGEFDTVDMHSGSLNAYSYEEDYYKKNGHTVENYNEYLAALWMNWSVDVNSDQEEITEYEKQKFDLGYLVYAKECDVTVSDTEVDKNGWIDSGFKRIKPISDAYKISGDKEEIYIYVKFDNDDESIGVAYEKKNEMKYAKLGSEQGKYLIGELDMKQYDGEVSVVILND